MVVQAARRKQRKFLQVLNLRNGVSQQVNETMLSVLYQTEEFLPLLRSKVLHILKYMSETLDCASRHSPLIFVHRNNSWVFLEDGLKQHGTKLKSRKKRECSLAFHLHAPICTLSNGTLTRWLCKSSALTTWSLVLSTRQVELIALLLEVCGPTLPDKVNENRCKTPWHQEM